MELLKLWRLTLVKPVMNQQEGNHPCCLSWVAPQIEVIHARLSLCTLLLLLLLYQTSCPHHPIAHSHHCNVLHALLHAFLVQLCHHRSSCGPSAVGDWGCYEGLEVKPCSLPDWSSGPLGAQSLKAWKQGSMWCWRRGCWRRWPRSDSETLTDQLHPIQYQVTQRWPEKTAGPDWHFVNRLHHQQTCSPSCP